MLVRIWVERTNPPEGWVGSGGDRRSFAGWLGLLGVLEDLMGANASLQTPADGFGGELGSGGRPELGQDV